MLFVCLGNICRSPMAEAIFSRLVKERGLEDKFSVASFGTSDCEEDNPVYPPAARVLKERGYNFFHRAKQIKRADILNADYVLAMDKSNLRDLKYLSPANAEKIFLLGGFSPNGGEVDDPWYTRDFDRAYDEIYGYCEAFLNFIMGATT